MSAILISSKPSLELTIITCLLPSSFNTLASGIIVITDGVTAIPFASSQDHKARDDMDLGPNTGGMGAYSPAPIVDEYIHDKIMQEVIYPTLNMGGTIHDQSAVTSLFSLASFFMNCINCFERLDLQGDYDSTMFSEASFENTYNKNQHMTYSGSLIATYKLVDFGS